MKKLLFIFTVIIFIDIFQFTIIAQEGDLSFESISDDLPNEITKYVENNFNIEAIFKDVLKNGISFSLKAFASVTILCVITVYVTSLCTDDKSRSYILKFISTYACSVSIFTLIYSQIEVISVYAQRLSQLMSGFLVFSNAVFLFCGYVSTAAMSSAWLGLIMNLIKMGVSTYMIPLVKIMCGVSLADQTICQGRLSSFSQMAKNTFLWISSIIITLISTVMAVQTSMSKVSDVASVQSIKFAATQAFPIVGGLVSESIRSVAGTANSAKAAGGAIVLSLIVIIALFPLSSLLGIKIGLSMAKIGCDMLGCYEVTEAINKAFSLINFMLACVGILASAFAISAISFMTQSLNISL